MSVEFSPQVLADIKRERVITGKEFAKRMHTEAVLENIALRQALADKSVGFDGADLVKLAREIAKSDKKVQIWQERTTKAVLKANND